MTLYLAGQWKGGEPEGAIEVPAETLISLFTLQYCQNSVVSVVLLPSRVDNTTCIFPVSLSSLVFPVVLQEERECPEVLQCCELPAMVLREEEEEEERCRRRKKQRKVREEGRNRQNEEEEEEKNGGLMNRRGGGGGEKGGEKSKDRVVENGGKEEEEEEEEEEKNGEIRPEEEEDKKEEEENKEEEEKEENKATNKETNTNNKTKKKEEEEEKEEGGGGGGGGGPWCCAGLCSSLRLAVKKITQGGGGGGKKHQRKTTTEKREGGGGGEEGYVNTNHYTTDLLGFRGGCLQACAEVSVWTKFCEVEAPAALLSAAQNPYSARDVLVYPGDLLRYEHHLRRPPILHNALKRTQQHIRETVSDATCEELCRRPLALLPPLAHQFAEGLDMTLADLMLFVCFHLILRSLASADVATADITPLVNTWHSTLALDAHIQGAMPVLELAQALMAAQTGTPSLKVPEVEDVSIYKSDPERNKSRGFFTRQGDVEEVLRLVEEAQVEEGYVHWPPDPSDSSSFLSSAGNLLLSSLFSSSSEFLPSSSSSSSTNPHSSSSSTTKSSSSSSSCSPALHTLLSSLSLEGHVPQTRLQRKTQQLQNICSATLALAKPGHTVVDFCAGAGHVGIPLAQCLPECRILLVENKVSSLQRARERVRELQLRNVWFVQSNLDYFRGPFDIGVSLHACGAATDLVLGKCMAKRAAFVVAPCCYGSIRPNHVVSYPRSSLFHALNLTPDQYLTLGHAADQTHGSDNPKTAQGQRCMRLVDGDRLAGVREVGYKAALALMHPSTCSPKNHLLLGMVT